MNPTSAPSRTPILPHILGYPRAITMEAPAALNTTSSYLPSAVDLIMVFPRLFSKASSLGDLMWSGGSVIAQPTASNLTNATVVTTAGQFVQESVAAAASGVTASPDEISMFQALKNVASFFSYITSKWAIATFAFVSTFTPWTNLILIINERPFS